MSTPKYLRLFFESAFSLMSLETRGFEFMYLEEFALNFRNKSVYGWGLKKRKDLSLIILITLVCPLLLDFQLVEYMGC